MGLSMAERKAVTREMAIRYRKAPKKQKKLILDELRLRGEAQKEVGPRRASGHS